MICTRCGREFETLNSKSAGDLCDPCCAAWESELDEHSEEGYMDGFEAGD